MHYYRFLTKLYITKKKLKENLIPTFKNLEEKTYVQHKLQYDVVSALVDAGLHTFIHFLIMYSVPTSGDIVVTKINKILAHTEFIFQW